MTTSLEQRIQHMEDQAAIKRVVDTFSNLADVKDIATQMQLFTEDAIVETYFGDTLFASMRGREEIGRTFSSFIENFETMYHMNGQCTVEIDGDRDVGLRGLPADGGAAHLGLDFASGAARAARAF